MSIHTYIHIYHIPISFYLGITQHPANNTFCKGTDATLSCIIFDYTTNDVADTTGWFINDDPPLRVEFTMINNTRDGDVVTSVLTIESVSLNHNGTGYFCEPVRGSDSFIGTVLVIGQYAGCT